MVSKIDLQLLVSEKGMDQQMDRSAIVFRVLPSATKQQIAQAVRERYKIEPLLVRTMMYRPKVRRRGRTEGRTRFWKKAYVTVEDVKSLNIAP